MAGTPWLDATEQRVWRTLLSVHARLLHRLDAELQEAHHLPLADYEVLVHLSEAPGRAVRMTELAQRLLLSPSGVTRRLDGLVRRGMVERRACPSDRRGSLAVLTDAGLDRLEAAAPTHVSGVRRYLLDAVGRDELVALGESLDAVGCRLSERTEGSITGDDRPPAEAAEVSGRPGR